MRHLLAAILSLLAFSPSLFADEKNAVRFLLSWGKEGKAPGEFHFPIGIAVNHADEVYVTDHYNNRVQKFDAQGKLLAHFAVLPNPGGMGVDAQGNLFISHFPASRFNKQPVPDRVSVYSRDGKFLREWGRTGTGDGELDFPGGVAVSKDGRVYVADQTNRRVQMFDTQGKFVGKWGEYGLKPGQFGGNSSPKSRVGGPQFVAIDSRGHVFTTEGSVGRVQEFTADGKFVHAWGDNERKPGSFGGPFEGFKTNLQGPVGICIDRHDRIWVAAISGRIQQFTREGKFLRGVGGKQGTEANEFFAPHGIALDSTGCLYVVDAYNHRVQKFSAAATEVAQEKPLLDHHHDLLHYLDKDGKKQKVTTREHWELRRQDILANMQKVMGEFPAASRRVPLDVKQVEEVKVGDLLRRKITFQSEAGQRVPAYLFLPGKREENRKLPAILCLHQTSRLGKGEPSGLGGNAELHYALHLAQRGFIVLAPDYPSFGEHTWDFKGKHGYVSGTMKAIWDNTRAVDLLQSLPEVDGQRIGCIGHSLGGHNALFTAAFEPRLRVIVSSCGFTTFLKDDMPSWTGPVYMPRITSIYKNDAKKVPFDFPEIVAALAPRPFFASAALHDDDFNVGGVKDCMNAARPVYDLFGQAANLQGYYPDCKHSFPADARKLAYEFLEKHLKAR